MSKDFDPSLRGQPEAPRNGRKILNRIQALRDRRDWPQIEAKIGRWSIEGLLADPGQLSEAGHISPEDLLKSPLNGFIPSPGDRDFEAFAEYTRLGAKRSD